VDVLENVVHPKNTSGGGHNLFPTDSNTELLIQDKHHQKLKECHPKAEPKMLLHQNKAYHTHPTINPKLPNLQTTKVCINNTDDKIPS